MALELDPLLNVKARKSHELHAISKEHGALRCLNFVPGGQTKTAGRGDFGSKSPSQSRSPNCQSTHTTMETESRNKSRGSKYPTVQDSGPNSH